MEFQADLAQRPEGPAIVTLAGEVDLFTAPQFDEALQRCIDQGAHHIVVDFSKVTFIDSTALSVLVAGSKRLVRGKLVIVCGLGNVLRLLQVAGLERLFVICPTLDEALEASRSPSVA